MSEFPTPEVVRSWLGDQQSVEFEHNGKKCRASLAQTWDQDGTPSTPTLMVTWKKAETLEVPNE